MRRTVNDPNNVHVPHAMTHRVGYLETSDIGPASSFKTSPPDCGSHRPAVTSSPSHPSSALPYVVTVGIDSSFPLPPSPVVIQKSFIPEASTSHGRYPISPSTSSRNSGILPQIGLTSEAGRQTAEWLDQQNSDDYLNNRTPSPMFHKDSPSSSNRSSTSSSNSSGYLGSNSQVNHALPVGRQQSRLSGHSSESGLSSITSSRYSYLSDSGSSHSSLDRLEETGGHGGQSYVNELFHRGLKESEIPYAWLNDLHLTECYPLFVQAGYDMPTISRMTPEDLTAIGITQPAIRKRLTLEISKLHISDGIPNHKPNTLLEWLQCIGLVEYYNILSKDGYENLDRVMDIIWEDLEEIGIRKLGHQKKIMLAIDRLKKLKLSMQRLSSTDQYTKATEIQRNQAPPIPTGSTNTRQGGVDASRLLRRSMSGENILHRDVNPSRFVLHPPVTSPMPPPPSPQPEVVVIQVNNASRSWASGSVDRDDVDSPEDAPAITYESFYGNPQLDFHCLRKEADGDMTPTNEKAASSEELDRTADGALIGVRFRPLLAPKPKLSCRTRRASGGTSLYSETEFCSNVFNWNGSFALVDGAKDCAPFDCHPSKVNLEFSRPTSAGISSQSMPNTPAHGKTSQRSAPPPPPKRTNSVKGDLSSSMTESEYANAEEHCQPCSPFSKTKPGNWETTHMMSISQDRAELSTRLVADVHSPRPEVVLPLDKVLTASLRKPRSSSTSVYLSPEKKSVPTSTVSGSSGSGSPDCNTLPFANENIGTIRQKSASKLLPMTKVRNDGKSFVVSDRDDVCRFVDAPEKTPRPDAAAVSRTPIRPVPKQKPKLTANQESKTPDTSAAADKDAAQNSEDVFNDIDDLFQGLSQELDQMLTFQG